jgi:hypothetical protein
VWNGGRLAAPLHGGRSCRYGPKGSNGRWLSLLGVCRAILWHTEQPCRNDNCARSSRERAVFVGLLPSWRDPCRVRQGSSDEFQNMCEALHQAPSMWWCTVSLHFMDGAGAPWAFAYSVRERNDNKSTASLPALVCFGGTAQPVLHSLLHAGQPRAAMLYGRAAAKSLCRVAEQFSTKHGQIDNVLRFRLDAMPS